ncbi:Predicted arabinose efflux permease, MFS family [Paenibacillus tianmuensis]|uniref:Predicted arabinose efflux permease, MFS family n=1 Tax=Paenibacillus tianmuensis TaxID=624147 RepID=A0A1G4QKC4_9BACL|nr:MFS transporter [Paenibacillus tianmuensis]SCW44917.1 Predicted arabinose efflux permease, MFS family [Paenibacillus tianmuensis]
MKEQHDIPASKLWTRDFVLLTISNLFLYLNLQMITPALPAYVIERFGAGQWTVSLVISVFALAAIVTRFFAGAWLKRGRTALILLLGLTVYMLATASYYAAGTLALFLLIRILYGIGFGVSSTAFGTMVSDMIPIRRMGEGMGYFGLSTSLSMSAAPLIGLWLLGSYGFGTLILVSSLLAILIIPLSLLIRSTLSVPKQATAPSPTAARDTRGTYKRVALPCFLNMLLSITYGGLISYLVLFGKEAHIGNVGWFFLCNAGAVLLVRPVAGKIFDKKGHIAVLPLGALMVAVGLVLLSYTSSMTGLLASALCYGIGYGVLQPSLQAWTVKQVSPEMRGTANGTFYNSIDLGIAVGSLLLGGIASGTSYSTMYLLSALAMLLFLAIYVAGTLVKGKPQATALHK